jgi:hypothetical protein
MRKFWQPVLFCTALLMAAPLAHAQTSPTSPRSTSTGFTGVAPTLPIPGGATQTPPSETRPTTPAETKPDTTITTASATGKMVVVEVPAWKHIDTFWYLVIMAGCIAAIVLVYYVFLRKRAD